MGRNENVAVVLGAGPGTGAAIARRFAREEFTVALMARTEDSLHAIREDIRARGGAAIVVPADATDPASVAAAFARVRAEVGDPAVFVYNVGDFPIAGILEITPEQFECSWKVDCFGAFLGAREVLPAMVRARRGTILLTGATASRRGAARFARFAVGKFGLRALAQSMAREFGPQGIHVAHVVIDGVIDTAEVRTFLPDRPADTLLSPDAIAEVYWQLHAQDRRAWTLELDLRPAVETF
jgi:NAD(P)-dependent dehydrogenase (short-subunit alcohol dehydrogenase family)